MLSIQQSWGTAHLHLVSSSSQTIRLGFPCPYVLSIQQSWRTLTYILPHFLTDYKTRIPLPLRAINPAVLGNSSLTSCLIFLTDYKTRIPLPLRATNPAVLENTHLHLASSSSQTIRLGFPSPYVLSIQQSWRTLTYILPHLPHRL